MIYIPMCEKPQIIINPRALFFIQHLDGQFNFEGITNTFQGAKINMLPKSMMIKRAYEITKGNHYEFLEPYKVSSASEFEYLFSIVPCNKCDLCGYRKQMDKVVRANMESAVTGVPAVWFTLTYRDADLPKNGELRYKDVQDFFKRLRIRLSRQGLPTDFRYIVSGEYGSVDKTCRPHYHVIMFNNPFRCSELDVDKFKRLKDMIFHAWSHSEPQSFDFGQCYGNAACYATKYLAKSFDMKGGHYIRPFVHASCKNGGLGRPLLESKKSFYQANLAQPTFQYRDVKGNIQDANFSSYIDNYLYPSPSRSVPFKQRALYRELIYTLQHAVQMNIITEKDAYDVAEDLRPYKNAVRNSFVPLDLKLHDCNEYFYYDGLQGVNYVFSLFPFLAGNFATILQNLAQELDFDVLVDENIAEKYKKFHDLHQFDFQTFQDKVTYAHKVKKQKGVLKSKIKL